MSWNKYHRCAIGRIYFSQHLGFPEVELLEPFELFEQFEVKYSKCVIIWSIMLKVLNSIDQIWSMKVKLIWITGNITPKCIFCPFQLQIVQTLQTVLTVQTFELFEQFTSGKPNCGTTVYIVLFVEFPYWQNRSCSKIIRMYSF